MPEVFDIFQKLLVDIHIPTKTENTQFHKDSEQAYELAFDIFHLVSEMNQDIEEDRSVEVSEVGPEAYELVERLKEILKEEIDNNDDIGKDNLLRSLYERANGVCGIMRQYSKEEYDEDDKD